MSWPAPWEYLPPRALSYSRSVAQRKAGTAALPRPGELEADLADAGFDITDTQVIVPTEPFLAVTATRR
jgi:hypothetical protein